MPTVQLLYARVRYLLVGGLEKRLNRALRGQPVEEDAAAQEGGAQPAHNENDEPGLLRTVLDLGRAAVGLLDGPDGAEIAVEVEVNRDFDFRIGFGDNELQDREFEEEDDALARQIDELGDVLGDEFQILPDPAEEQHQEQPQQQQQQEQPPADQIQPPPPPPPQQQPQNQPQPPPPTTTTPTLNQPTPHNLLHHHPTPPPAISYGMGELIRLAARVTPARLFFSGASDRPRGACWTNGGGAV
ncbi:hypothetical protein N0V88_003298 [Collariella sp. IMI 366227]|nr:hypothetical protein N0V88_003298 [Collariella sp. IMI 366227]